MHHRTRWAPVAALGLLPLLILLGCPNPDGDCGGFGCGDDDDAGNDEFACPNVWWGFSGTVDDWSFISVLARGPSDFDLGDRNLAEYEIIPAEWDPEFLGIEVLDMPGACFMDFGGMFLGDGEDYPQNLYSVSYSLSSDGDWPGGSLQVIPTDGEDPYPIGDPNSIRGTAIEPDGEGGFVVCGSLEAGVDNAVIWVDFDGTILSKDELPSGSCHDLAMDEYGIYYVTDVVADKVYRYELDTGEFGEVGSLPGDGPINDGNWVVGVDPSGLLFLGDDSDLYTMDPVTGSTSYYTYYTDTGTSGAHSLRFDYSEQLGQMTASSCLRDSHSSGYEGPTAAAVVQMGGADIRPGVIWGYGIDQGKVVVDYEVLDLTEWIANQP